MGEATQFSQTRAPKAAVVLCELVFVAVYPVAVEGPKPGNYEFYTDRSTFWQWQRFIFFGRRPADIIPLSFEVILTDCDMNDCHYKHADELAPLQEFKMSIC